MLKLGGKCITEENVIEFLKQKDEEKATKEAVKIAKLNAKRRLSMPSTQMPEHNNAEQPQQNNNEEQVPAAKRLKVAKCKKCRVQLHRNVAKETFLKVFSTHCDRQIL